MWYRIFGIFLYAELSEGLSPSEVEAECARPLSLICGPKPLRERELELTRLINDVVKQAEESERHY